MTLARLLRDHLKPGELATLWGRSGTGKTGIATYLALQRLLEGDLVLYITDDVPGLGEKLVLMQDGLDEIEKMGIPISRSMRERLVVISMEKFSDQGRIFTRLPFMFLPRLLTPGQPITCPPREEGEEGKDEKDAVAGVVPDLSRMNEEFKEPGTIIVDEFTRILQKTILKEGVRNQAEKLAFLAALVRQETGTRETRTLLTGGSVTRFQELDDERFRLESVPAGTALVEHFSDVIIGISSSIDPGIKRVNISRNDNVVNEMIRLDEVFSLDGLRPSD